MECLSALSVFPGSLRGCPFFLLVIQFDPLDHGTWLKREWIPPAAGRLAHETEARFNRVLSGSKMSL